MNKSLHAMLIQICTNGGDPLFNSCYDGIIARKMLPMSFISPNTWKSEGAKSRQGVVGQSSPKIGNVLHSLQTGMGPGIITLWEKGCLLLWPSSGSLSLQLSQCRSIVLRADGLSRLLPVARSSKLNTIFKVPSHQSHVQRNSSFQKKAENGQC